MKKLRLVAVGKLKERYFADAFDEYARRIGRFADFSVVETRESRSEGRCSCSISAGSSCRARRSPPA